MNVTHPLRKLVAGVAFDGAGTPELLSLSHHKGYQNTGKDARKTDEHFARSNCPENGGQRPERQASRTRNVFLSFTMGLNEATRATHRNI
jgi:hypothetical protein